MLDDLQNQETSDEEVIQKLDNLEKQLERNKCLLYYIKNT